MSALECGRANPFRTCAGPVLMRPAASGSGFAYPYCDACYDDAQKAVTRR